MAEYTEGVIESTQQKEPTLEESLNKVLSLEEFLKNMGGYQEALKNPHLAVSLTNVKNLIKETLESAGESELSEEVMEMDRQDLVEFLDMIPDIEQRHEERASKVQQRLGEVKEAQQFSATKAAEVIIEAMRLSINTQAKAFAQGFTPSTLFGETTFKDLLHNMIEGTLERKGVSSKPIRNMATGAAEVFRKNLAENMGLLADEKNMARLGIKMANTLAETVKAINELDANATPEDLIKKLGHGDLSEEEFKKQMDSAINEDLSKPCSKNAVKPQDEGTRNMAKKLWTILKTGIKKVIMKFQKRTAKKALNRFVPQTRILDKLSKKLSKPQGAMRLLGFEKEMKNIQQCSDVLTLYLFHTLTKEMADIAHESHRTMANVSGFATPEEANQKFRDSIGGLSEELVGLKSQKNPGLIKKGLYKLVGLLGNVAQKQGSGDSILDVTTPAFEVLQPAWKDWLST